jgi:hypothetical protein
MNAKIRFASDMNNGFEGQFPCAGLNGSAERNDTSPPQLSKWGGSCSSSNRSRDPLEVAKATKGLGCDSMHLR